MQNYWKRKTLDSTEFNNHRLNFSQWLKNKELNNKNINNCDNKQQRNLSRPATWRNVDARRGLSKIHIHIYIFTSKILMLISPENAHNVDNVVCQWTHVDITTLCDNWTNRHTHKHTHKHTNTHKHRQNLAIKFFSIHCRITLLANCDDSCRTSDDNELYRNFRRNMTTDARKTR